MQQIYKHSTNHFENKMEEKMLIVVNFKQRFKVVILKIVVHYKSSQPPKP